MPFQPFDLGQIMATAENIKSSRLQQQYLGERGKRETAQFDQATQAENTALLAQAAESIVNAPPGQAVQQAYNIAKKLKAKGILEFDEATLGNWTDENVRGFAKQKLGEVAPFVPQQDPGQLQSVIGPDGQPILLPRSQAVGQQPAPDAPAQPRIPTSFLEFQEGQKNPAYAQHLAQQNAGELSDEAGIRLQHQLATERDTSKIAATGAAKQVATTQENQKALAVWESAKAGLTSALENTATGPIVGRFPAVTANQQIAEGAEAAVAPVLKQLFRTSAEGTFSDRDQDLLIAMIPTRTDRPETRVAKLANIDSIVRSKLGAAPQTASIPGANPTADTAGWSIEPIP